MVTTSKRNTTLQKLLLTRNGPGAAVILQPHPQSPQHPRLTRIFVKIDPRNQEQRKFWRWRLVRLKYHNPSLPITVLRRTGDAKDQRSTMSRVVLFWESERREVLEDLTKSWRMKKSLWGRWWNPKRVLSWQSANAGETIEEKGRRQRGQSAPKGEEIEMEGEEEKEEEEEEDEDVEITAEVDGSGDQELSQDSTKAASSTLSEASTTKPSSTASDRRRLAERTIQTSKPQHPQLAKISDQRYSDFLKRINRITISTTSQSTTKSSSSPSTSTPPATTYRATTRFPIPPHLSYQHLWTHLAYLLPHTPIKESASDTASRLISEEKAREAAANRIRTRAANDIKKREEEALRRAKEEAARSVAEAI